MATMRLAVSDWATLAVRVLARAGWLLPIGLAACSSSSSHADAGGTDAGHARDSAQTPSDASDASACESSVPSGNDLRTDSGPFADAGCDGACPGIRNGLPIPNVTGEATTFSPTVAGDASIPTGSSDFSHTYGTNGRTCFTCHAFDDGWTLSTFAVQMDFDSNSMVASNDDLVPVFRTNDGTNSPNADVSTPAARQAAYSMLLTKAVIRVGMAMPKNAEFTLTAVDDPYHFASAAQLSLFRRPLPTQNLAFESDIMWDGRETVPCEPVSLAIANQANDAILSHANASSPLSEETRTAIADFEKTLFAAQVTDLNAGPLDDNGALGGAVHLAAQPFYLGMNDSAGQDPQGKAFNPVVFTLFDAWASGTQPANYASARASIVHGQTLFNTRTFSVTGVRGLNDDLGQATVQATCSTCHDTPNVGNNSLAHRYDIGVSDASQRTPDLPLYTFKNNQTGEVIESTDPGRALISGQWKDMGRFKVPALRNAAARFPFFHNGSAGLLSDAVTYHNQRFNIGLTDSEMADLTAFLEAL